ncbi:hypothetical protein IMCC1989_1540 [gamma proteobacterium IMCC1989]|nr:hypothetical protein IMCC1989_1540 [gamma proteobacterium IMCC1989]
MEGLQPLVDQPLVGRECSTRDQYSVVEQALIEKLVLLKQQGVSQQNSVRLCFIESLIRRSLEQRESVRERLLTKAQLALDAYEIAFDKLTAEAATEKTATEKTTTEKTTTEKTTTEQISKLPMVKPSSVVLALSSLRKVLADDAVVENTVTGFGGDGSIADAVEKGDTAIKFAEQLSQQEQVLLNNKAQKSTRSTPLPRLKAGVAYQQFQHQQRVDQFIDSAFNETPENPGPLNPEILAIKLLRQINDLSPAYISRYVGYFETLQWLAQEIPPAPKQKK